MLQIYRKSDKVQYRVCAHVRLSAQLKGVELKDLEVNMVFIKQTELNVNAHSWLWSAGGSSQQTMTWYWPPVGKHPDCPEQNNRDWESCRCQLVLISATDAAGTIKPSAFDGTGSFGLYVLPPCSLQHPQSVLSESPPSSNVKVLTSMCLQLIQYLFAL